MLTEQQKTAIRCAYADLLGAHQCHTQNDMHAHDWDAHTMSMADLETAFPELRLEG
jgi:hypothetical protein